MKKILGNQDTSTTGSLNLFFSTATEEAGLDDERLGGETTTGQNLSITSLKSINDWDGITVLLGSTNFLRNQTPKLVNVQGRTPGRLTSNMEVTHTNLTKVSGMVTVHVGTVMVHTTSQTTTSWMLTVLTNTTVTG